MMIGEAGAGNAGNYYQMYTALSRTGNSDGQNGKVTGAANAKDVTEGECKTCAERKYVDGSNDAGVSFKTPTSVAPEAAASAVMAHEQEHVSREQSKADEEGRRVISQNVQIHMGVCPECGKSYVSGGTTTTVTGADNSRQRAEEPGKGQNFDMIA